LLVARERFNYLDPSPKPIRRESQVKTVHKIKAKTILVYCVVVLVAFGLALLVTSRHVQIASAGYDILALRKQVKTLEIENQSLENKIDELKSLGNIERIATTKLGMQKPELAEGVQFVPVEYSKASSKNSVGVASTDGPGGQPTVKQKRNSLVQALADIING